MIAQNSRNLANSKERLKQTDHTNRCLLADLGKTFDLIWLKIIVLGTG